MTLATAGESHGPALVAILTGLPAGLAPAAAREAGATVVGGLEVLVAQGSASFELWTGVAAPRDLMRAAVGA